MTYLTVDNLTSASGDAAAELGCKQPGCTSHSRASLLGGLPSRCKAECQADLQVSICEYNFRENNQTY